MRERFQSLLPVNCSLEACACRELMNGGSGDLQFLASTRSPLGLLERTEANQLDVLLQGHCPYDGSEHSFQRTASRHFRQFSFCDSFDQFNLVQSIFL